MSTLRPQDQDTIAALATAAGVSGIAVIRVSGSKALQICRKIAGFLPINVESHKLYYGHLIDDVGQPLDEGMIVFFEAGRSFTGESTCELHLHGNPIIVDRGLHVLVKLGCRIAERGEFTYRAFLNNRIDLLQAQSVLSLIQSRSVLGTQVALRQLKGSPSQTLFDFLAEIELVLAHLEANIDFIEQNLATDSYPLLVERLKSVAARLNEFIRSSHSMRPLESSFKVALVGAPNAGKSSLLNTLVGYDRSIVSAAAGTTRDFVDVTVEWDDISITLIDTAGLRDTKDEVESVGVKRSLEKIDDSNLVLHIVDPSQPSESESSPSLEGKGWRVANKSDLYSIPPQGFDFLVSAKTGAGLDLLKKAVVEFFRPNLGFEGAIGLRPEQFTALKIVLERVNEAIRLLGEDQSPEFISFELIEARLKLNSIFGKTDKKDLVDSIFAQFCVGK